MSSVPRTHVLGPTTESAGRRTVIDTIETVRRALRREIHVLTARPEFKCSSFTTGSNGPPRLLPEVSPLNEGGAAALDLTRGSIVTADCGNPRPSAARSRVTLKGQPSRTEPLMCPVVR